RRTARAKGTGGDRYDHENAGRRVAGRGPRLHLGSCAPPVLDGLRATLASRGGSGRRGELRHRMRGLGAFQRKLLSPRHGALSFALRRRDLLPWRFKAGCAPSRSVLAPEHRLTIDHEDATRFAANAVPLNGSIILSSCSERLRRRLEERGFAVIATPLQAF